MSAMLLPKYLLGSRRAILELAGSRWTVAIGVLFVISAGLAREYDGEDLVHEPWHALRPLAASLASGTALFLLVHLAAWMKSGQSEGDRPTLADAYTRFMGLFWMTAPMAWLYAVPYERFMSPVDAIRLNLWTLALVALWRVVLMVRVVHVLYGIGYASAFFIVMLFADAVVFVVLSTVPTPVIDVMGGIRHSERDALIASVTLSVGLLSVLTAPLWIIGALVSLTTLRPKWPSISTPDASGRSRGLLVVALMSLLAFVPLLIASQPEQMNKRSAVALMEKGEVAEALALMSRYEPSDFPPQWNPPPRIGYRETQPSLSDVREAMAADWPAEWVAAIYLDKIERDLKVQLMRFWYDASWSEMQEAMSEDPQHYRVDEEQRATAAFLAERAISLNEADSAALNWIATQALSIEPNDADGQPEAEASERP
jgi:hypothetical protein